MSKFSKSILIACLLVALGQSVFIRKQTIKTDEVLGEVVVIEEIQTVNSNNLDLVIEDNAAFIEEELDYASQLTSYMINSLEEGLMEDHMIEESGTVFNALESLKGIVNNMQKAEHEYLEEVQHQKEEKEKRLEELEHQVEMDIQIAQQTQIQDDSVSNNIQNTTTATNQNTEDQNNSSKEETQKARHKKRQTPSTFNFDNSVSNGQQEDSAQTTVENDKTNGETQWITNDDEENENKANEEDQFGVQNENDKSTNFNSTPEQPKAKAQIKLPYMGLGPQKSMKQLNTTSSSVEYHPLYKDPSMIIGAVSLFVVVGCIIYYFIRSKMNLRKSSSTILETKNEIYLTHPLKHNRDEDAQPLYEKVKLI